MSELMPEVRDVFLHKYTKKKHIAFKIDRGEIFLLFLINGVPQCTSVFTDRLAEDYEYLGKSKVNIKDLFEVQDDNR